MVKERSFSREGGVVGGLMLINPRPDALWCTGRLRWSGEPGLLPVVKADQRGDRAKGGRGPETEGLWGVMVGTRELRVGQCPWGTARCGPRPKGKSGTESPGGDVLNLPVSPGEKQ